MQGGKWDLEILMLLIWIGKLEISELIILIRVLGPNP